MRASCTQERRFEPFHICSGRLAIHVQIERSRPCCFSNLDQWKHAIFRSQKALPSMFFLLYQRSALRTTLAAEANYGMLQIPQYKPKRPELSR